MGETGADIKYSEAAHSKVPLSIECKNREGFTTLYRAYEQAEANRSKDQEPVLIIKQNGEKPLAVVDASYFFKFFERV